MKCEWLEQVAVAMDGEWTSEVQAHVDGCPVCGGLLSDREWLRQPPPVPESSLVPLGQRRRTAPWWPTAAAAAVALLVFAGWEARRADSVPPLPVAVKHPAAPALAAPPLRATAVPLRKRPRSAMAAPKGSGDALAHALAGTVAPSASEPAIRLYTGDPNVIIMLVTESKGVADD